MNKRLLRPACSDFQICFSRAWKSKLVQTSNLLYPGPGKSKLAQTSNLFFSRTQFVFFRAGKKQIGSDFQFAFSRA